MHPWLRTSLPYINFGVAVSALAFQVTVLYPWHCVLDDDFKQLRIEQEKKLQEFHKLKLQRLETIEAKLEELTSKFSKR